MRQLLFMFVGIMFFFAQADAAVYEWVDDRGVTHFTDDPDRVPTKFLNRVKTSESISGDSNRKPESQAVSDPLPVQAVTTVTEYGGHNEVWWRSSFTRVRTEIKQLQDSLQAKNEELTVLQHKKRVYQRAMDRVKYNNQQESIKKDQEILSELEQKLATLENEASSAGVPFDWRR